MNARELAEKLDLKKYPRSWRGSCPACSYSGSTFSVKAGKTGLPQLYCANGCSRNDLSQAVATRIGEGWKAAEHTTEPDDAAKRASRLAAAEKLWQGSEPAALSPVATYLAARGLAGLEQSRALRFRGDAHHPEGGRLQAMVAEVVDVNARLIGVHRTYLRRDGKAKASVTPDKASLGPIWGGAVRLQNGIVCSDGGDIPAPQLVVGEGIESSASAGRLMNLPAWAALSAGNLAKGLMLPADIRHVVIACDNDLRASNGRFPGQEAAQAACWRWRSEGRKARIAKPDQPGADFNDLLLQGLQASNG